MLCLWSCFIFHIALCLGFSDVSFRSKPQKPVSAVPKEPDWVTNLRSNMKQAVREEGFEAAKPAIKQLIDEANEEINGPQTYHIPTAVFNPKNPMRVRPPKRYVPQWERDLITYVRELMQEHGKEISLDPYVEPVIESIENKHNVKIHNVDGQIIVRYDNLNNNGGRPSGLEPRGQYGITGYED